MKLQSNKKVIVKGKVFGGERYLYCISVRARDRRGLLETAKKAMQYNPDMIEFRIDYIMPMQEADYALENAVATLKELSKAIGNTPLLYCFRLRREYSDFDYPASIRLKMLEACLKTGLIDFVDVGIDGTEEGEAIYVDQVKSLVNASNAQLVLSQHDWSGIIDEEQLLKKMQKFQNEGAAIGKLYLAAVKTEDLVKIAKVAKKAKEENLVDIPFCFTTMNDIGLINRVFGYQYGADYGYYSIIGAKGGFEEDINIYLDLCEAYGTQSNLK